MIPAKNNTYQLLFTSSGSDPSELNYSGPGTYTGEFIKNDEGIKLFLFENLTLDKGFTEHGWFSETDILRKL